MGDSDVGKTSIVNRFINDTFSEWKPDNPNRNDYARKDIVINKVNVSFKIEVSDNEEEVPCDFSKAKACVAVFDFSNKYSINNVRNYLSLSVRFNSDDKHLQYMVGNKIDALQGVRYHAVSAKTGEGISEFFESIAADVIKVYGISNSKSGKSKRNNKGKCLLF
ncbi:Sphingomyelin phosphodiesterase [Entamoeba marina]